MIMKATATKTERLVMTALMMSLILIGTVVIRIPIPLTQGYVHVGDALIYVAVLTLGKKHGAFAAVAGSALADILGGFAMWAPWTFAIKALMALIAGIFIEHAAEHSDKRKVRAAALTGMILGGLEMTAGYFIAEGIMYGNWPVAMLGIPWNIGQFAVGIVIAGMIYEGISKIR